MTSPGRPPAPGAAPLFTIEAGGLEARCMAGRGSSILVVVFSQVRVPAGSFGLSRLFARTAHACLFLNQPENRWYRRAEAAIDAAIGDAVAAVRPTRVIFYGSSMGAWGALAAAARWPDVEAVAFAPDFRIGEPSSRSAGAGLRPDPDEPDLADLLACARAGRVTVLSGLFDPYDAGVAVRLAAGGFPEAVRLVTVASVHEIHDHLYAMNVVRRIIATFTRDPGGEVAARGLSLPLDPPDAYARFAALAVEADAGRMPAAGAVAALGLHGNPGADMLQARALLGEGRHAEALDVLSRLDGRLSCDPVLSSLPKRYRKQVPRWRIALLLAEGRAEEAAAVSAEAASRFPTDSSFVKD